ncbi:sugar isomerase domain-containing protein [Thermaerobacter litoralis]
MSADRYLAEVRRLLTHIETTQMPVIREVARAVADLVKGGGVVHLFGAGHAHLVAEEAFARAGGLIPTAAVLDPGFMVYGGFLKNSALERLPGFGRLVFEHHDAKPGEILVVHSQSGKNAAPVDVALAARERGLRIVAITSLAHSRQVPSGHPSGRKLFEIADWVIDNGCPHGDAALDFGPGRPRVAPLSTVAGTVIWNMVVAEVAAILASHTATETAHESSDSGFFPFWVSANVEGGQEANQRYIQMYRDRWRNLI